MKVGELKKQLKPLDWKLHIIVVGSLHKDGEDP